VGLSPLMLNLLYYHSHPCHHITKMRNKTRHANETRHVFTVFPNFFENRGSVSGEPWSWIQRTWMKIVEALFLFLITADRWQSTLFTLGVTSHKILQWEKVHLVFAFSRERTLAGFERARETVTRVRCAVFVVFVAVEEWAQFIFVRDCKLAAAHNHISIVSAKKIKIEVGVDSLGRRKQTALSLPFQLSGNPPPRRTPWVFAVSWLVFVCFFSLLSRSRNFGLGLRVLSDQCWCQNFTWKWSGFP
jgi:hypothetical protein